MNRCRGVTLVELLVVLVIIVSVVAVAVPAFSGTGRTVELKAAARQLVASLRLVRSQAIAQRREMSLWLDVAHNRYRVPGRTRAYTLQPGLRLALLANDSEAPADGLHAVRFFPDGGSSGAEISVRSERRGYLLKVAWLTGRISVYEQARADHERL